VLTGTRSPSHACALDDDQFFRFSSVDGFVADDQAVDVAVLLDEAIAFRNSRSFRQRASSSGVQGRLHRLSGSLFVFVHPAPTVP